MIREAAFTAPELRSTLYLCRHPESSERPSFQDVTKQLSVADSKLLQWSEEDKAIDHEALKLGGDLLSAQDLYRDLRTKYEML